MDKKKPDLRKEALNAIRSVENEPQGVIQFMTDCKSQSGLVAGTPEILANMIANAINNDPELIKIIHMGLTLVAAKVASGSPLGKK